MGIEPTPSAWKAEVLPLNYTRLAHPSWVFGLRKSRLPNVAHCANSTPVCKVVEGEGFEPSKAEPTDLQSAPFDRSGTPPKFELCILMVKGRVVNRPHQVFAKWSIESIIIIG